jgi:hypothetical protein
MYQVRLGNTAPIEAYTLSKAEHARELGADEDQVKALRAELRELPEGAEVLFTRDAVIDNGHSHQNSVTVMNVPSVDVLLDEDGKPKGERGRPLLEVLAEVTNAYDVYHSNDPPEWVEVSGAKGFEGLALMLSSNYSVGGHECVVGKPDGWEGLDFELPPIGGGAAELLPEEFTEEFRSRWREHELRTNAGTDWQARIMGDSATTGAGTSTMRAADFIALTENSTAPAAGNTTLTGELSADGLSRAQGTYAHTNGTNTYTITRAYTFTRASAVDRTIAKIGVFNASSTGTMAFETLLSATQLLQANGDQLTVTQTVTL